MSNEPAVLPNPDRPVAALALAPAPAPGVPPAHAWRELIAGLVELVPIVGKPLASTIKNGAWPVLLVLLWVIWIFFLYPLLLPLIASAWINAGVLGERSTSYAEPVRQAFGAKEFADGVARESNRRLDYVQAIEYEADASLDRSTVLSVAQNQKVIYQIESASLISDDKKCPVPPELNRPNALLFTLQAEGVSLAEIRNGPQSEHNLTPAKWKEISDKGGSPDRLTLTVLPVTALSTIRCGKVKVQMRMIFKVYKDLVGAST